MKQLVSIATIEKVIEAKQTECRVDGNAIITAAAVDLAEENGINIIKEAHTVESIDQTQLLDSLKALMGNRDFIQSMIKSLEEPYRYELDYLHFPKNTSMEISFDEVCKLLTIHPE